MTSAEIGQEKLEHAILWSLVRGRHESGGVAPSTVALHLNAIASEQAIHVGLKHLANCNFVRIRPLSIGPNYEPTREGILLVERLIKIKASFVGRLEIHGSRWLKSASAMDAKLQSRIAADPLIELSESPPSVQNDRAIHIHNELKPNYNNISTEKASEDSDRSSARASWFSGWVALLGAIVAACGVAASLWASGKIN